MLFKRSKKKDKKNEAVIFAYPTFVYAWPLIVFGYLFAGIQNLGWIGPQGIAWTYIFLVSLVMLTMGVDLGRNTSIFCLVAIVAIWMNILWLQAAKDITIFAKLGAYIRSLEPAFSSSALTSISTILLIIYLIMIVMARINDRWRFTNNEIEHRSWGRRDDAFGRGAKRVQASYPDFLELLICLAGTLKLYSANGAKEIATIENVPFLLFRMKKIDRILETKSVTTMDAADDDEEDDD